MKLQLTRALAILVVLSACIWAGAPLRAQTTAKDLEPVTGSYALTGVNIVPSPGKMIPMGTVLIKDGLIVAAGKDISIPGDAKVIAADSMYVYAGFIDGLSNTGLPKPKTPERGQRPQVDDPGNPSNEQAGIQPERAAKDMLDAAEKSIATMRELGFTTAHIVPHGNMLPGSGAIIQLSGEKADDMVLKDQTSFFSQFKTNRRIYPGTVIGMMAKWRELYRQAELAKKHKEAYANNPAGMKRPEYDRVLEAFFPVIDQKQAVFFLTEELLEAHRAMALQKDLGFPIVLAGLKQGWDISDEIKSGNIPVLLSMDLPKEPKVEKKKPSKQGTASVDDDDESRGEKERTALEKRQTEAYKKFCSQAAIFKEAGIPFSFSTMGTSAKNVRENLRTMIKHGLSEEAALAALTTDAAKMLGLSQVMGTIEKGKIANLVISNKSYFEEKSNVRYVFVDGQLFEYEVKAKKKSGGKADENAVAKVVGTWEYTANTPGGESGGTIILKNNGGNLSGSITNDQADGGERELENIEVDGNEVTFDITVDAGGQTLSINIEMTVEDDTFEGSMNVGSMGSFDLEGTRTSKPD